MNAENFAEYLKNPSRLYQVNYQELKSLALQYPYCQNLQWLLLYKSGLDHHRDFDANLEKTSTGSLNRTLLFRQMQTVLEQEKPTEALRFDEVLELRDLSPLQLAPQPVPVREETPTPIQETPPPPPVSEAPLEKVAAPEAPIAKEMTPPPAPEVVHIAPEPTPAVEDALPPDEEATTPEAPAMPPADERPTGTTPTPKSAFSGWSDYQAPRLQIPAVVPAAKASKQQKEDAIKKIALDSLAEKDGVASETLANLLARQGQYERAVKMYERLILLFPEKSAYFAAQIFKLKRP
ncbi:MAG TPA: hypothetical protein PKC76_03895 [Saprospiraceae bacterium]|nr:hypothetical protein [Saprospiraceae bacterium]HMP23245.1 hypothetical protein [Saprospiraceae bacterium]